MLYWLLYELHVQWGPLNVFRYITFRAALAILTAVVVGIPPGPPLIRLLRERQIGQTIREEGPASHHAKAGTPTMGGLLILGAIVAPILLWGDLTEPWVWVVTLTTLLFGAIGRLAPVPLVQLPPGAAFHGRRRVAGARRRDRLHRCDHQAGTGAGGGGRALRGRGALGDPAGGELQNSGQ